MHHPPLVASRRAYREGVDGRVTSVLDAFDGAGAVELVRAPGRVNLIGDHTDYNDGFCLPLAIDRACVVGTRARTDGRTVARSLDVAGVAEWRGPAPALETLEPRWSRFVAAALDAAPHPAGVDVVVASSVPVGSGLSSSAALAVALLRALAGPGLAGTNLAVAARAVEVAATGVPVGLMDQLTSVLGQAGSALLLDCRALTAEAVPLPRAARVGVVHSGLPRALAASAYAERRAACEAAARRLRLPSLREARLDQVRDDPIARHVVSENERVLATADALRRGDVGAAGSLLVASHASLRDDYAVSTVELDILVDLLLEEGALGARLTGAGFGGCVVALTDATDGVAPLERAADRYRARTGRTPQPFLVEAVDGAGPALPR